MAVFATRGARRPRRVLRHPLAGGACEIHGTNQPETIGRDVSHGCIRVHNDVIRGLARLLPLGTPVEIRA